MKMFNVLILAKRSLLITAAVSSLGVGVVVASAVEGFVSPTDAAKAARQSADEFSKKHYAAAITLGEKALRGEPRNANYRMMLGQANFSAGRFASAQTLFSDVLTLDPTNSRAALNLALVQTALDHAPEARATLEVHREQIAPADYGLALALAGDVTNATRTLEVAARAEGANAKTRQNLALAYALGGRWEESKTLAAQDLSPDMVDQRMADWAQMAHPAAAWEPVAALLHVTPVNDPGLPYQLALNDSKADDLAAAAPAPASMAPDGVDAAAPRYETSSLTAPAPALEPALTDAPVPVALAAKPKARAASLVKPKPVKLIRAAAGPAKRFVAERPRTKASATAEARAKHPLVKVSAYRSTKGEHFVVQLGSYKSSVLVQSAWKHSVKKVAALRRYDPAESRLKLRAASYYRLAATGFASRNEAGAVCTKLRAAGTSCFVRLVSGDQLAAWARPHNAVHLAAHTTKAAPKLAVKTPKSAPKPASPALAKSATKPAVKPAPVASGQLAARR